MAARGLRKGLAILREEKWLVLNLAVAGFLVALLALALVPRTYTTETVYRVAGTADTTGAVDRYLALLRDETVADDASSLLAGVPSAAVIRASVSGEAGEDDTVVVRVTTSRAEDGPLLASAVGTVFMRLVDQRESVGRPVNRPASTVEQVAPSSQPTAGPWSQPVVVLPAGIAVGLVMGLLLALARSRRWGTVADADALRRHTGLPVLAALTSSDEAPLHPADLSAGAAGADDEDDVDVRTEREAARRRESAERLADVVRRAPGSGATLVVVGAGPEQYTSTVVLDLAVALARTGERVAVVDGDVPTGVLAARTGLDTTPGFHEVIAGTEALDGAVRRWDAGGVDVLPAGSHDAWSDRRLADPRAAEVLAGLAADHDRVLVDTAGRAGAAGAVDLARHADAAVVVIRRGSRLGDAEFALAALRLARVRVLGAVLTDALDVRDGEAVAPR